MTMQTAEIRTVSKSSLRTGVVISALVILFLVFDSAVKLINSTVAIDATTRLGYQASILIPLGIVLLLCTILYAVPRTAILGAILLTAYLGGATATHVRIGDPYYFPIVMGILLWAGLYLRDPRVRTLIPIRA